MLILRTLRFGPAHGHQISKHIHRTTDDVLQVEHGSLYPALHRLERKGWITAKWEPAGKDLKREFKYYRLTTAGKKQLVAEESRWKQLARAIARVMWRWQPPRFRLACLAPGSHSDAQARIKVGDTDALTLRIRFNLARNRHRLRRFAAPIFYPY
jgi:PadR family transcriptional regulator PadR